MMYLKKESKKIPAVFSINQENQWYMEMPDAIYQGNDSEALFILFCDIVLDLIEELPQGSSIIGQIQQI